MNNLVMFQRRGFGALSPSLASLGYTEDVRGNVYYPDGTIAYGPDVLSATRGRYFNIVPVGNITPGSATGTTTAAPPPGVTAEQWAAYLRAQAGGAPSGLGVRVTGEGIVFGDNSKISWPMIMLAIGAIVLIQMRPVTRATR
jgi:hypothetical protein